MQFNLVLDRCIRKVEINTRENIYNRSWQYLACTDDVVIMEKTRQALVGSYQELERKLQRAKLKISEEKAEYILKTGYERREKGRTRIGNHSYEEVQEFKYLGSKITDSNETSEEIKSKIAAANKGCNLKKVYSNPGT